MGKKSLGSHLKEQKYYATMEIRNPAKINIRLTNEK